MDTLLLELVPTYVCFLCFAISVGTRIRHASYNKILISNTKSKKPCTLLANLSKSQLRDYILGGQQDSLLNLNHLNYSLLPVWEVWGIWQMLLSDPKVYCYGLLII